MKAHVSLRLALLVVVSAALVAAACGSDTEEGLVDEATATAEDEEVAEDPETVEEDASNDTETPADADPEDDQTPAEPEDGTTAEAAGPDVDLELFYDGAIVGDPVLDDCVLTDGSTSQCYTITVAGEPANHDVGPFCPTSITDGADAGGLWLDGENAYEMDGEFFTELAAIYGDEEWNNIYNDDGSINVIDNAEDFAVAARPDITEEFYYNCVDGQIAWLDGGEAYTATVQIPVTPVLAGETTEFTSLHSDLGITLNGVLLSGTADMEAILASYTIAAFDDCGGHINPALGYHVHGTAGCSEVGDAPEGETAPFAYALDGFTVHEPYEDGTDVELDECNGHTSEEYGYHYHASPLEDNATLTCLNGLTSAEANAGAGPGGGGGGGGERPARPDEGE